MQKKPPISPKSLETIKPKKKKNSASLKKKFELLQAIEQRTGIERDGRKCIRWMTPKPDEVINPDWVWNEEHTKRLCERWAIAGATICMKHGGNAPQVKKAAAERMLGLLERKVERLNEISEQNTHMPSALGATQAMINRVMGKVGDGPKASNVGPTVNIGFGFSPGERPQVVTVGMQQLPEPVIDTEVVEVDDDDDA